MTRAGFPILLLLAAGAVGAPPLGAQEGPILTGRVVEIATLAPLSSATVAIEQQDLSTRTDRDGTFTLGPLPSGEYVLRVAAAGYATLRLRFAVPPNAPAILNVGDVSLSAAPAGTATLRGRVLDDATGHPLRWTTLHLDGAIAAVADSTGAFHLTDVPWGAHRLEARRLGYRPAALDLELDPDDPATEIGIALVPLPVELPAAHVSADAAPDVVPRLRAFEARRQKGFGHFMTRDEIEQRKPVDVTDLFRTVPGMRVVPGGGIQPDRVELVARPFFAHCQDPLLFVDGINVLGGALDDIITPLQIEAIEVYTRASHVPAEFNQTGSACGVIVIWSRSGIRTRE